MITLKNLENCFHYANEEDAKYVAIIVEGIGSAPEIIINPAANFEDKKTYYLNAYNEDLTLKANPAIRISSFTHADSFDEIQALLGV